jgi:hypothetical protein
MKKRKSDRILRRYIGLSLYLRALHETSREPFFVIIKNLAPLTEYGKIVCPVTGEVFPPGSYREKPESVSPCEWEFQAMLYERSEHKAYPDGGGILLWESGAPVWYIVARKAKVRRREGPAFEDALQLLGQRRSEREQEVRRKELETNGIDAAIRRQIVQSQKTGKRPVCGYF